MNIWTYWETPRGQQIPPYINFCLDTLKRYNPQLIILTPNNLKEYVGDNLHSHFSRLSRIAHRADCARVAVIEKNGGWWVDADTIGVDQIDKIGIDNSTDMLYSRWRDGRVLNGYFYGRQGSPIMKSWLEYINKKLAMALNDLSWTAFGEGILNTLVFEPRLKSACKEIPLSTFLPLNIDTVPKMFFESIDHRAFLKENTVCFGLNHSWFSDNIPELLEMSVNEIAESNTLIGDLFNKSRKDLWSERLPKESA